ncbi:MAG: tetratricopeptide repeat protein, partial [Bryobacteraceae bacterium]
MRRPHGVLRILVAGVALLAMAGSGEARVRKGDKLLAEGNKAEQRRDWDAALELYEKALAIDPSDTAYQIAARRVRFQAAQAHVDLGQKLRGQGELEKALAEFQRAYAIDPSSTIAEQELRRTLEIIERNKKAGAALRPEDRSLAPAELDKKRELETIARLEPAPELKPLARTPLSLKMTNQPPRVLFEAVGKLAGINVVFDPDYGSEQQAVRRNLSIELNNATLEDALDYLATMTRSFWKPLSPNAILVTQDTVAKRREYEDSVVRVFYLSNLTTTTELQEINTVVRTVTGMQKVFPYNTMNALIVRGSPDQVLLAEKLINDLDKPRAEVVVDVLVMEANRAKTRDLAATIGTLNSSGTLAAGLNSQLMFTPRNPVLFGNNQNVITTTTTDTAGNVTTVTTPISSTTTNYPYGSQYGSPYGYPTTSYQTGGTTNNLTNQLMSLARIAHVSTNDFSVTLPGALLQAVMSDRSTRVLQSPQVRAASGQK